MRITRVQVDNFLGIHSVDVKLDTAVTLFSGSNAAGKSSLQEAVRMAITGETVRVSKIKDYGQLVADGAKAGGVLIKVGDDETGFGNYQFTVPKGDLSYTDGLPTDVSIGASLDAQSFASMSSDDKRTFLFSLTGCKASMEEVKKRLVAKECNEEKFEAVLPLLRTGFPAACKQAEENATESKRNWKGNTGAVYGSKVAEGWKAPKPVAIVDNDALPDDLVALDADISALNQQIGASKAVINAYEEAKTKREALRKKAESVEDVAGNLTDAKDRLDHYLPDVIAMRERASGSKRVGLVHDMAAFLLDATLIPDDAEVCAKLIDRYEDEHGEISRGEVDQDAKASLPEYERGLEVMQNAVKNLERDLESAKAAKAAYDALAPAEATSGSAGDLDALQSRLAILKTSRDKLQADIRAVEQYEAAVEAAKVKTANAAEHHIDVTEWLAIAAALAPDGIPGDLLAEALKPINQTLKLASTDTKWPQVEISKDMEVTAKGRAYALLSESEKWRVDAMIAQAIAKISGHKILMLDRMDVLDLKGRTELLGWLDMLADDGHIETALLFATLKAMPSGLPPTMQAFWLADGSIAEYKAAA